jgi:hypothetical protein
MELAYVKELLHLAARVEMESIYPFDIIKVRGTQKMIIGVKNRLNSPLYVQNIKPNN